MMLFGLTINDFIGEVNIDLNDTNVQNQFNSLALQHQKDILIELLNGKLYNNLYADLSTSFVPQTQKYIDLVNGVTYVRTSGETVIFEGLKRMTKYFIYDYYQQTSRTFNTSLGQMTGKNENSVNLDRSQLKKERQLIQHKAINLYNMSIQFINDNYTDYFTGNNYSFWTPKQMKYLGSITTLTPGNNYFYNRSSEEN